MTASPISYSKARRCWFRSSRTRSGSKGARLTTQITIPSRYLVFLPNTHTLGVSQRIEDEQERNRLREIVKLWMQESGHEGYIIRTAAEGVTEEHLCADREFLCRLWIPSPRRLKRSRARQHRARGFAPGAAHAAGSRSHRGGEGAYRFARDLSAHQGLCGQIRAGVRGAHGVLSRRAPAVRSLRGRGRDPEGACSAACSSSPAAI